MIMRDFLWAGVLSLLPISELRGGIPYAMTVGNAPWYLAFAWCVFMNALAAPIAFIFLNSLHKLFLRMKWYERLFARFVERSRAKISGPVDKFGYWGLMLFVAIPFPLTGAWTGALGAWVLGMQKRKAIPAVIAGVVIAGVIVTLIMTLGIKGFDIFLKRA